ncbi:MAG: hypothetical protein WCH96_07405 [Betaproteobacteria bacterium]|jgi:hypothetical protein
MIVYMVEHLFSRPDWESEWNAWYEKNLKILLAVPGFLSGQRFRNAAKEPRYMAMYTVESPAVFESEVYLAAGGGGTNSRRFREAYAVWIRNLFSTDSIAPPVKDNEYLWVEDVTTPPLTVSAGALCLPCVGLHQTTAYRCLSLHQTIPTLVAANTLVYRSITPQQGPLY